MEDIQRINLRYTGNHFIVQGIQHKYLKKSFIRRRLPLMYSFFHSKIMWFCLQENMNISAN